MQQLGLLPLPFFVCQAAVHIFWAISVNWSSQRQLKALQKWPIASSLDMYEAEIQMQTEMWANAHTHAHAHAHAQGQQDRQCSVIIAHFTVWCNNYSKTNNNNNNKNKQHLAHIQNCQQPKQAYSPNPIATLSLSLALPLATTLPLPCPFLASAVISLFLIIWNNSHTFPALPVFVVFRPTRSRKRERQKIKYKYKWRFIGNCFVFFFLPEKYVLAWDKLKWA